ADALHWQREDFGPAVADILERLAAEETGALVLLEERIDPDALLARVQQSPEPPRAGRGSALTEWRRNGAGSQILSDLGFGRLRVLGTPRKQVGLAGFGLEVVEYVAP